MKRNLAVIDLYRSGTKVEDIAWKYNLCPVSVRRILYSMLPIEEYNPFIKKGLSYGNTDN
jgi:hypothetical protein